MAIRLTGAAGTWTLPEGDTILGRGAGAGILIADRRLTRQHARFSVTRQGLTVVDLGTTNGVLVAGDRITGPTLLHQGMSVVCGPIVLRVEITAETAPADVSATNATLFAPDDLPAGAPPAGSVRRRTEPMDQAQLATLAEESRGSRKLAPAILSAIHGHADSGPQPTHQDANTTGPLAPGPPSPQGRIPEKPYHTTSHLMPAEAAPATTGPLQASHTRQGRVHLRTALVHATAAAADGLQAAALGLGLALPLAGVGLALALANAGAALTPDGIALPPPNGAGPAGVGTLFQALPGALAGGTLVPLLRTLREMDQTAILLPLLGGLAVSAVTVELPFLIGLVAATVRQGAPFWHRRLGLTLVLRRNGHRPGWTRAICRWLLFALLWPCAVVSIWSGRRSLHDVLCGTEVRQA